MGRADGGGKEGDGMEIGRLGGLEIGGKKHAHLAEAKMSGGMEEGQPGGAGQGIGEERRPPRTPSRLGGYDNHTKQQQ